MASKWLETLKSAQKTCLVQDGRRKIHFTLKDGSELTEEYDVRSSDLIVRKWKRAGTLGGSGKWEFEVGETPVVRNAELEGGLVESATNPIFVRKDTSKTFQFRVRNLPYPLDTYDVRVDEEANAVIIRTTNKKYYKKFSIPDMERVQVKLDQSSLSVAHANNTLIVTYQKPSEVLSMERAVQAELKNIKAIKDGDVDCKPS